MNEKSNIKILSSDRFSCKVTNIVSLKRYKGITVEEPFSKSYVYFGKVPLSSTISIGSILYIGIQRLNEEQNDKSMKVTLYDNENSILDWTFIY